jgi:hypothetical protein
MYLIAMENPLIGGFVEKQHEIKSPAWSKQTTEGLSSPSDCHNLAAPAGWLFWNFMAHPLLGEEDSTSPPRWL